MSDTDIPVLEGESRRRSFPSEKTMVRNEEMEMRAIYDTRENADLFNMSNNDLSTITGNLPINVIF